MKAAQEWLAQSANKEPPPTELQRQYLRVTQELPKRKVKRRTVLLTSVAVTALVCTARALLIASMKRQLRSPTSGLKP